MGAETFDYCVRAGLTDVGCKRSANEDNLGQAITINGLVTVVCDGMGGHVGGAVASKIAVDTILAFLNRQYFADPREAIVAAVNEANQAILARTTVEPSLYGMGSTCVMLIIRDGLVYYGWVGDSRIYLFRQDKIVRLSKDQSVVQALVDAGQITEAEAEHHSRKNEITNALGLPTMTPALVCRQPIAPEAGDTFMLCSDGLTGMVSDSDIAAVVSDRANLRLPDRASRLIEMAKANGGLDNVTTLLVEFPVAPRQTASAQSPITAKHGKTGKKPIKRLIIPCVVALGVIILAIAAWLIFGGKDDKAQTKEKKTDKTELTSTKDNEDKVVVKALEPKDIKPISKVSFTATIAEPKKDDCVVFIFFNDKMCNLYDASHPDTPVVSLTGSIDPISITTSDNLELVAEDELNTSGRFHVQEGMTPVGLRVKGELKPNSVTVLKFKTPATDKQESTEYTITLNVATK